jgi:hypothetical protein
VITVTIASLIASIIITTSTSAQIERSKHIRRLAIKNAEGNIIGVITLMSIIGNVPRDKIDLTNAEMHTNVIEQQKKIDLSLL